MEEKQESSLSERDKEQIKWAVLRAVENGCLEPALIADRCCFALERINRYGKIRVLGVVELLIPLLMNKLLYFG